VTFSISFASKIVLQFGKIRKGEKIMKKRLLFVLCFIIGVGNLAFAQTRTVTNTDLEKFRQKRLEAERDYRENYAKMGFPSPEELKRRQEESRRELEELAQRLREERLAREEAEALQRQIEALEEQVNYLQSLNNANAQFDAGYSGYVPLVSSGGTFFNRRHRRFGSRFFGRRSSVFGRVHFGGGAGVFPPVPLRPIRQPIRIRAPRKIR
jgi:hypothetical protein